MDSRKMRDRINTVNTHLIRRKLRDFSNFPLDGGDENQKQPIKKIMAKGGNDNGGRANKIMAD